MTSSFNSKLESKMASIYSSAKYEVIKIFKFAPHIFDKRRGNSGLQSFIDKINLPEAHQLFFIGIGKFGHQYIFQKSHIFLNRSGIFASITNCSLLADIKLPTLTTTNIKRFFNGLSSQLPCLTVISL